MKKAVVLFYLVLMVYTHVVGEDQDVWIFPTVSFIESIDQYNKSFDFTNARKYKYYSLEPGYQDYPFLVADKNYIYLRDSIPTFRLEKRNIITENDGFMSFSEGSNKWIIITGGGYFATNRIASKRLKVTITQLHDARNYLLKNKYENVHYDLLDTSFLLPQVIKSVRMSVPFLEETIKGVKYKYDDDILLYRWFYKYLDRATVAMFFINDPTPMVEGAPGNGEGLTIDITYHIPSDNLVVLNGFVDLERRHLYKRNARMKKVLVQGEGFEFEYEFQDYVHFAQIDLPKKVTQVRLTVLEVYDGTHYEDLCISGFFMNPDIMNTRNSPFAYELLEEAQKDWQNKK